MYRLYQKYLSILLIFMLGLSPLQSVMADIAATGQDKSPCPMSSMHNNMDMDMHVQHSTGDTTDDHCKKSCCSLDQCSSHLLALFMAFSAPATPDASFVFLQAEENTIHQQPPVLLRPPRA